MQLSTFYAISRFVRDLPARFEPRYGQRPSSHEQRIILIWRCAIAAFPSVFQPHDDPQNPTVLTGSLPHVVHSMSEPSIERATIRVPATSANLGPGFDCLGMAVDLWNETIVTRGESSVKISGEGADSLPTDNSNLIAMSARHTFKALGVDETDLSFKCINNVPLTRGLGSSSAATVTGIAAAFAFANQDLADDGTRKRMFAIAADIEGHPDNAAPAVFGGCQIGIQVEEESAHLGWITSRVSISDALKTVAFVPDFSMQTEEARGILPEQLPRSDAVFNVGRAAMLVHALSSGQWDLMRHATDDRLHQPQRIKHLFPRFRPIARGALDAGAHGVFLSGAGPTIMALATDRFMTICYEMSENARKAQIEGKAMVLDISNDGVQIQIGT